MAKYEIIPYWSAEDDAFIAEVPELPGCAADGGTRIEALKNVETVIQEWIETARELGRPIPEPKGVSSSPETTPGAAGDCPTRALDVRVGKRRNIEFVPVKVRDLITFLENAGWHPYLGRPSGLPKCRRPDYGCIRETQ
jgi:predicted RNase H-like HicB family nuclease